MESISLEDLDEVDLLLTELEISQGRRNLILCIVASPAYREKVIEVIKARFPCRVQAVEKGDNLISDLQKCSGRERGNSHLDSSRDACQDILDALNNFRELFYDAGVPSLIFMTPAALDEVIWKAPDFWRYRGGYHILKGEDHCRDFQAVEALSMPQGFSYQNKEELLRRKRINEYLLEKIMDQRERGKILAELGIVHSLLSEPRKAIDYYEKALVIARKIGDKKSEANALGNLGMPTIAWAMHERPPCTMSRHLRLTARSGTREAKGPTWETWDWPTPNWARLARPSITTSNIWPYPVRSKTKGAKEPTWETWAMPTQNLARFDKAIRVLRSSAGHHP